MNLERSLDIIGILPKKLTLEKVKSHYHKLTVIHHPDKGGDNDFYCILVDAYKFLTKYIETGASQPEKRPVDPNPPRDFTSICRPKCNHIGCTIRCDTMFDRYCKQHIKFKRTSDKQCTKIIYDRKLNCNRQCKCKCLIDKNFCTQHVKS